MSEIKLSLPQHVGLILDGNRQWARKQGLSPLKGHEQGYRQIQIIVEHAIDMGIPYITLYAFSTQNWNRSKYEVAYLMRLLLKMFARDSYIYHKKGIKIRVIGTRERLSKTIIKVINAVENLTKNNTRGTVIVAFNYESRVEMVETVKKIIRKKTPASKITEKFISDNLYTAGIPDPDLIIRTSNERRLSGFLLWQAAYSELYFTKTLWPAFTPKDFDAAIRDYQLRNRRFGK